MAPLGAIFFASSPWISPMHLQNAYAPGAIALPPGSQGRVVKFVRVPVVIRTSRIDLI
jgi:hypothetical protein